MLVLFVKILIKNFVLMFGFVLNRVSRISNPAFQQMKSMEHFGVDLVFDIGANVGQYVNELRSVGYKGHFVSFEPLSAAHDKLIRRAQRDPLWQVHGRCAIGESDGYAEINIAGNSVSSSILPMLDSHSDAAAGSAYIGHESVPQFKLDSVTKSYLHSGTRYLLKIDTQGYEWAVLAGAKETLRGATGIQLELSLVPLYEGQQLWHELIAWLEGEGFTLWALQKGFTNPRNGRTLQVDALFFRVEDTA